MPIRFADKAIVGAQHVAPLPRRDKNTPAAKWRLIIGYGVTGKALGAFFAARGWPYLIAEDAFAVRVDDGACGGQVRLENQELRLADVTVPPNAIMEVYPSPGVSPAHPVANWLRGHGIPLSSDLELAAHHLQGELIGVTGTNGKSTTVKLISTLLANAGLKTGIYGNYGTPLVSAVSETPKNYYVVEESSFQLELIATLKNKIAVCLNVTDDHFDRYPDIHAYARAKARVLLNSGTGDVFVYNADDPHCARMAQSCPDVLGAPFSMVNEAAAGATVRDDAMVVKWNGGEYRYPLDACALKGLHNAENMMAALLVAHTVVGDAERKKSFSATLASFAGLPHRVEKIHSAGGVDYYDDSKGTNVGAVAMALAGFQGNVILIAGGRDKLGDYAPLKGLVAAKVKRLILIGEASGRMREALGAETQTVIVGDMRTAVLLAKNSACPGDTVLMSPACSSFDQYRDYKERGLDFQKWVKEA